FRAPGLAGCCRGQGVVTRALGAGPCVIRSSSPLLAQAAARLFHGAPAAPLAATRRLRATSSHPPRHALLFFHTLRRPGHARASRRVGAGVGGAGTPAAAAAQAGRVAAGSGASRRAAAQDRRAGSSTTESIMPATSTHGAVQAAARARRTQAVSATAA
ncbi:unnamed protein product, partial [Prorocentrum cordatum]